MVENGFKRIFMAIVYGLIMMLLTGCGNDEKSSVEVEISTEQTIQESEEMETDVSVEEESTGVKEASVESSAENSTETTVTETTVTETQVEPDSQYTVYDFSDKAVGSKITFGHYDQDSYLYNGKEEIEWTILDEQGDKILVITSYFLDHKPFNEHESMEAVNWENSSLRKWLNDEFLYTAFTEEERNAILDTVIEEADCGNPTTNKLFCLSRDEYEKYFAEGGFFNHKDSPVGTKNKDRFPDAAEKFNIKGLDQKVQFAAEEWWLRTKEFVDEPDGSIIDDHYAVCTVPWSESNYAEADRSRSVSVDYWVRPAMWIPKVIKLENKTEDTQISDLSGLNIGDEFVFGSLEQDGVYANGKEALEWYVLDKQDGKLLAINKYGYYYDLEEFCPYSMSTNTRQYVLDRRNELLEYGFYQEGFTEAEKKLIIPQDGMHVIIFSYDEYRKYFDNGTNVPVGATMWNGDFIPGGWALSSDYSGVEANGRVWGSNAVHNYVRPIIWISLP